MSLVLILTFRPIIYQYKKQRFNFFLSSFKLKTRDNGYDVYDALECIQKHGTVRDFWKCVDQEHILHHYPQLSEIIATLKKCENTSV